MGCIFLCDGVARAQRLHEAATVSEFNQQLGGLLAQGWRLQAHAQALPAQREGEQRSFRRLTGAGAIGQVMAARPPVASRCASSNSSSGRRIGANGSSRASSSAAGSPVMAYCSMCVNSTTRSPASGSAWVAGESGGVVYMQEFLSGLGDGGPQVKPAHCERWRGRGGHSFLVAVSNRTRVRNGSKHFAPFRRAMCCHFFRCKSVFVSSPP